MPVIGLTGSFGSGCSYIAKEILCSEEEGRRDVDKHYKLSSLTRFLKGLYQTEAEKDLSTATRWELQDFGDAKRKKDPAFFAKLACKEIGNISEDDRWVVDSIRNPAEIHYLREKYHKEFYLFAVHAPRERRETRVLAKKFKNDRDAFLRADERDTGESSPEHGQRVGDCFLEADAILPNDPKADYEKPGNKEFREDLVARVDKLLERVKEAQSGLQADPEESLMAMAYVASQRSNCARRKVGAVVVDRNENVLSSGCNSVPPKEQTCEERYKGCYRADVRRAYLDALVATVPGLEDKRAEVEALLTSQIKSLDVCRALHAEESAILWLARNGRSGPLGECTLYTTTFPCRLCANKIAALGIKTVVYLEPYPDPAAKGILENAGVTARFFEGITYRGYFRVYGKER